MHMVRYTVAPEHAAHNERLVRAVLHELAEVRPAGLRYAVLRLSDGLTFIHVISHDEGAGPVPGGRLHALRAFHEGLRERCAEPPERSELSLIGAVGLDGHDMPG